MPNRCHRDLRLQPTICGIYKKSGNATYSSGNGVFLYNFKVTEANLRLKYEQTSGHISDTGLTNRALMGQKTSLGTVL